MQIHNFRSPHHVLFCFQNQDQHNLLTYAFTEVNLTTFHLTQSEETMSNEVGSGQFTSFEYGSVHDSLLTLYDGVLLHQRSTGSCQWSGREHIFSALSKVFCSFVRSFLPSFLLPSFLPSFIHSFISQSVSQSDSYILY